jgi:hypothetical protein
MNMDLLQLHQARYVCINNSPAHGTLHLHTRFLVRQQLKGLPKTQGGKKERKKQEEPAAVHVTKEQKVN